MSRRQIDPLRPLTARACDGRSLSMPRAEQQVWGYIRSFLSNPDLLRRHLKVSRGDPAVDSRNERKPARLERQIAAARDGQRLINAYQSGMIELAELQEQRQRSDQHTRFLRQRVDEIERKRLAGNRNSARYRDWRGSAPAFGTLGAHRLSLVAPDF